MHHRFHDPDHRSLREFARREQARIAEAGDDVAVDPIGLALADRWSTASRPRSSWSRAWYRSACARPRPALRRPLPKPYTGAFAAYAPTDLAPLRADQ